MEDITQKGVGGLKGLEALTDYNNLPDADFEQLLNNMTGSQKKDAVQASSSAALNQREYSTGQNLGSSKYDKDILTQDDLANIGDMRASEQSGLAKLTNGILKGGVLAANYIC